MPVGNLVEGKLAGLTDRLFILTGRRLEEYSFAEAGSLQLVSSRPAPVQFIFLSTRLFLHAGSVWTFEDAATLDASGRLCRIALDPAQTDGCSPTPGDIAGQSEEGVWFFNSRDGMLHLRETADGGSSTRAWPHSLGRPNSADGRPIFPAVPQLGFGSWLSPEIVDGKLKLRLHRITEGPGNGDAPPFEPRDLRLEAHSGAGLFWAESREANFTWLLEPL